MIHLDFSQECKCKKEQTIIEPFIQFYLPQFYPTITETKVECPDEINRQTKSPDYFLKDFGIAIEIKEIHNQKEREEFIKMARSIQNLQEKFEAIKNSYKIKGDYLVEPFDPVENKQIDVVLDGIFKTINFIDNGQSPHHAENHQYGKECKICIKKEEIIEKDKVWPLSDMPFGVECKRCKGGKSVDILINKHRIWIRKIGDKVANITFQLPVELNWWGPTDTTFEAGIEDANKKFYSFDSANKCILLMALKTYVDATDEYVPLNDLADLFCRRFKERIHDLPKSKYNHINEVWLQTKEVDDQFLHIKIMGNLTRDERDIKVLRIDEINKYFTVFYPRNKSLIETNPFKKILDDPEWLRDPAKKAREEAYKALDDCRKKQND